MILKYRNFLNVVRELEAFDGNVESVAMRRKYKPRSVTVRELQFVQQVQDIIAEYPSKSIRAILRDLHVSECTIRHIVNEDIRYKSYVMGRGHFMSAQTLLLPIKPCQHKIGCPIICMITQPQTYGHLLPGS